MHDFHSAHPRPVQDGCTPIDWSTPTGRCSSARIRDHTCGCLTVWYELCTAAGLAYIRRTERTSTGERVGESPWRHTAEVNELWTALLDGRAR